MSFTIRHFYGLKFSMVCDYCQEEYSIKQYFIAKNCICDDENRFLSFDFWYWDVFKFDPSLI